MIRVISLTIKVEQDHDGSTHISVPANVTFGIVSGTQEFLSGKHFWKRAALQAYNTSYLSHNNSVIAGILCILFHRVGKQNSKEKFMFNTTYVVFSRAFTWSSSNSSVSVSLNKNIP